MLAVILIPAISLVVVSQTRMHSHMFVRALACFYARVYHISRRPPGDSQLEDDTHRTGVCWDEEDLPRTHCGRTVPRNLRPDSRTSRIVPCRCASTAGRSGQQSCACERVCVRACVCACVWGFLGHQRCCCRDFDGATLPIRLQAREPVPTLLPAHTKDCRNYHGGSHRIASPHQVV
jgi:hypothetical protein